MPGHRFNGVSWTHWREAVQAFAACEVGGRAKALFATLLTLLLVINGLNVVNSYVGRDFMTAIEERDVPRFFGKALLYVGVFAVSTATAVLQRPGGLMRSAWTHGSGTLISPNRHRNRSIATLSRPADPMARR